MTDLLQVRVPDIGELEGVSIVEVLVEVGQHVVRDDSLLTLESDKASMEIPAPATGVVEEVFVKVGDSVSEETVLLTLVVEDRSAVDAEAPASEVSAESATSQQPPIADPPVTPIDEPAQEASSPPAEGKVAELPAVHEQPREGETDSGHQAHASPGIRRFARQLGVDLLRISGSGRKHRILRSDVEEFVKQSLAAPAMSSGPGAGFEWPAIPAVDFSRFGPTEDRALGRIQKVSARNLHRSWLNIPHVTQFDKADISELEAFRRRHKDEAAARGVKLTLLSFLMKACAVALEKFPELRSSLAETGESLIIKNYYHLGIAVDTDNGLVVPVIRDVDKKSLYGLGKELAEVSSRARAGQLLPQDFQGGCFTISSLGGIGGTAFTPIINAPEVGILGVSRAAEELSMVDGKVGSRLMLPLSLSYDHRVIDGAGAARFIVHLSSLLGDVGRMIL